MELYRGLRIKPGDLVAFSGAGGKTSAIQQLLAELSSTISLLIATTTNFGVDQFSQLSNHLIDNEQDMEFVADKLQSAGVLLWTGPLDGTRSKWTGVAPARINQFKATAAALGAVVLIEADGARQRWIKAPAAHEPVIPEKTDLVVPVANLMALNQPLNDQIAHRPQLVARTSSGELDKSISTMHLISLIANESGGLKGVPGSAKVRPLFNGVSFDDPMPAVAVARGCLQESEKIISVVLTDLAAEADNVRAISRVAGVVLAAGGASRMGELKQLKEWKNKTMVSHAVDAALGAGLDPVVVVTGFEGELVQSGLTGANVQFVHNAAWERGQSTSMVLGLNHVQQMAEAVVFLLADMPLVGSDLIARLIYQHQRDLAPIVVPVVSGRYGNPVLFDREAFQALMAVDGDTGGKAIFDKYEISMVKADQSAIIDIDSQEDWAQLGD